MRNLFINRPRHFPIVPPRVLPSACTGDCYQGRECACAPRGAPLTLWERRLLVAICAASAAASGTLVWFVFSAVREVFRA